MANKNRSLKAYLLFVETWFLLAIARLLLFFLPFKKIVPVLGSVNSDNAPLNTINNEIFALLCLSIKRACRYSPWRTKCFEQAIAAKMALRRRQIICTIFFGVYQNIDDNKLKAHAWLESNGVVITGGGNLEQYTIVGSFTG
jgi:hypothetical protein